MRPDHRQHAASDVAVPLLGTRCLGALSFLCVLLADQISKWWILFIYHLPEKESVALAANVNLTMVWNRAVTFGMLSSIGRHGPAVFCLVALLAVAILLWQMLRTSRWRVAMASAAIAGGAVGNVLDRLRFGAVVDFIHLHAFGWSWYVFNLADSAIVCGVVLWVVDSLMTETLHAS